MTAGIVNLHLDELDEERQADCEDSNCYDACDSSTCDSGHCQTES